MARAQKRRTGPANPAHQEFHSRAARDSRAASRGSRTAAAASRRPFIQRYRAALVLGILAGAVVAGGVIFVLKYGPSASGKLISAGDAPAAPALVAAVTGISPATYDAVGAGSASSSVTAITGAAPLSEDGKPEMLYMGAEYCPFCAAERWAMLAALSRFGSFSNLHTAQSSASDIYPNTATFSFYSSQYTSPYLTFTPVETSSNQPSANGGYTTLENPTSDQQAVFQHYNAPPYVQTAGSIPFVDFGGKYVLSGATYDPGVLAGKTWDQIAQQLNTPTSAEAKAIDGSANVLTAAICGMTGQQPANVCSSDGVTQAAKELTSTR